VSNNKLLPVVVLMLIILATAYSRVFERLVLRNIASVELEPEPWETPAELAALH